MQDEEEASRMEQAGINGTTAPRKMDSLSSESKKNDGFFANVKAKFSSATEAVSGRV